MEQIYLHDCRKKTSPTLVTDSIAGEVCCSACGIVIREKIVDRTNETRGFSKEDYFSKSRTGSPAKIYMHDMGNSSKISKENHDASGRYFSSKSKIRFSRLRLWDSRSKNNSKARNLNHVFNKLNSIANKLNLPENAKEHSAYIYRKATEKRIIQGNSVQTMISAAVYVTCREFGIPRSLDEIVQVTNIERKTLSRNYRRLVQKLELDITPTKVDFVSKVANLVGVSERIKRTSNKILDDAKKCDIHVGKNPMGLAAGAVYISAIGSGEKITMQKIAKKSNISTVTIRKIVRLLRPFAAKYIKSIDITS